MMTSRLKSMRTPREPARRALITGATGGLGEAFARALPYETNFILTGRDEAKLSEMRAEFGTRCETVVADLTKRGELEQVVEAANAGGVDLLINNAGLGEYGSFLSTDFEKHRTAVRVNIEAVLELIHHIVPGMIHRADIAGSRAGLINVSSSLAFIPVPTFATYAASKAMVLSFTESLAAELSDEPIDVLASCPGAVKTEFGARAGYGGAAVPTAMTPERVAKASLDALGRQSTVVIGPVSAAAFGGVSLARSLFGQAFMRASTVMERMKDRG